MREIKNQQINLFRLKLMHKRGKERSSRYLVELPRGRHLKIMEVMVEMTEAWKK